MNIFPNPKGNRHVLIFNTKPEVDEIIHRTTHSNSGTVGNLFGAHQRVLYPLHVSADQAREDVVFSKEQSVNQLGRGEVAYDHVDIVNPLFYPGNVACHSYQERVLNKQLPPTTAAVSSSSPSLNSQIECSSAAATTTAAAQDPQEPAKKRPRKRKVTKDQSFSLLGY